MGQHAFVVVTGEGRVFEPATVQPGSEQPHAPPLAISSSSSPKKANSGHGRSLIRKSGRHDQAERQHKTAAIHGPLVIGAIK